MSTGAVYRTTDGGASWRPRNAGISSYFPPVPTPQFGQCVHKIARGAVHPRRAGTIRVVPLVADGERVPPGGRLAVHRSDDAGETWRELSAGLPEHECNAVLRDAAWVDVGDPVGVYVGTRGGGVHASADEGSRSPPSPRTCPTCCACGRRCWGDRAREVSEERSNVANPTDERHLRRAGAARGGHRRPAARRAGGRAPRLRPAGARPDRSAAPLRQRLRRRRRVLRLAGLATPVPPGAGVVVVQSVAGG